MLPMLPNNNYKEQHIGELKKLGGERPCVAKLVSVISNVSGVDKLFFCRIYI